jgi:hypothetical protein
MKILKITGAVLLAVLLFTFIYANARTLSLSENLEEVDLITYTLNENLSLAESLDIENKFGATAGVTACTVSKEGDKISLIFHPTTISKAELTSTLIGYESRVSTPVVYAEAAACPVHKVTGSVEWFIAVLDLRNYNQ